MTGNVIQFRKTDADKARVQAMADQAIDFLNRHDTSATDDDFVKRAQALEAQAMDVLEKIFRLTATRYAAYSKGRELVRLSLERVYPI